MQDDDDHRTDYIISEAQALTSEIYRLITTREPTAANQIVAFVALAEVAKLLCGTGEAGAHLRDRLIACLSSALYLPDADDG